MKENNKRMRILVKEAKKKYVTPRLKKFRNILRKVTAAPPGP